MQLASFVGLLLWCHCVLLVTAADVATPPLALNTTDTFVTSVKFLLSTSTTLNIERDFSTAVLNALESNICSDILAMFAAAAPSSLSKDCFLSFDQATMFVHLAITTGTLSASYGVYTTITPWSATNFAPLASIRQRVFVSLKLPVSGVFLDSIKSSMPCRSQWTVPTATVAPTAAPSSALFCSNTNNASDTPQSILMAVYTAAPTTAAAIFGAVCDGGMRATGSKCPGITVADSQVNAVDSNYELYRTMVQYSVTMTNQMNMVLLFGHSCRDRAIATVNSANIQRIYLYGSPPSYMPARIYAIDENISPNSPPMLMYCPKFYDYWTLILLIFAPIFYILFRQAYHAGKKRGIKNEKKVIAEEDEIQKLEEDRIYQEQLAATGGVIDPQQQQSMGLGAPSYGGAMQGGGQLSQEQLQYLMQQQMLAQQQQLWQQQQWDATQSQTMYGSYANVGGGGNAQYPATIMSMANANAPPISSLPPSNTQR